DGWSRDARAGLAGSRGMAGEPGVRRTRHPGLRGPPFAYRAPERRAPGRAADLRLVAIRRVHVRFPHESRDRTVLDWAGDGGPGARDLRIGRAIPRRAPG